MVAQLALGRSHAAADCYAGVPMTAMSAGINVPLAAKIPMICWSRND